MFAARNMMFSRSSASLDADAVAYIAALETAGATVTSGQRTAINEFVEGEKAGSRWTSHKRLYLPIWGVAAANAICMKSLTSGTFVGGVTHGAGFVQGDGSTGYFDMGVSSATLGLSTSGGHLFTLVSLADTNTNARFLTGSRDISNRRSDLYHNGLSQIASQMFSTSAYFTKTTGGNVGIFIANISSSTSRYLKRRLAAGVDFTEVSALSNATAPSTFNQFAMALNNVGTPVSFTIARMGGYGAGVGMSSADGDAFTLALKTLWETCTGLTLP